jgi:hypothetical protein
MFRLHSFRFSPSFFNGVDRNRRSRTPFRQSGQREDMPSARKLQLILQWQVQSVDNFLSLVIREEEVSSVGSYP